MLGKKGREEGTTSMPTVQKIREKNLVFCVATVATVLSDENKRASLPEACLYCHL